MAVFAHVSKNQLLKSQSFSNKKMEKGFVFLIITDTVISTINI
jgi:hypothetical protein